MPPGKQTFVGLVLIVAICSAGCEKSATTAAKTGKTSLVKKTKPTKLAKQSSQSKIDFEKLLPDDTMLYVRIDDVQRAKTEFINPKHVKDAKTARPAWLSMLDESLKFFSGPGKSYGFSVLTLMQLANEIKTVHVGVIPSPTVSEIPVSEFVGFVEVSDASGLDALQKQLAGKLKTVTIAGRQVQFADALKKSAFFRPTPTSIVLGTQSSIRSLLEQAAKSNRRSLADSPRFQQALHDFGASGDLFTFADLERLQVAGLTFPLKEVSHLAASLGVDGGFALRAYAADGKSLPVRTTRTSRKKMLLARLPRETAVLLSASFDADRARRRRFADWVAQLVTTDDVLRASAVPQGVRNLAKSFFAKTAGAESDAAGILKDLWFGLGPVKSESAIFVAPNSRGQWGAAALFDIEDAAAVAAFKEKLHAVGRRLKLEWHQETAGQITVHTLDVRKLITGVDPQPVPEMVERLLQLKIGYAETKERFAVGSVDLLKFVLKPREKSLADKFTYDHLDEANAMMFSIRPGRILDRKFGFAPVDNVLRKVASQIPIDSNYTFTLALEPRHATLRSNIPFTSLVGWLVLEWMGKGPAHLKDEFPESKKPPVQKPVKKAPAGA